MYDPTSLARYYALRAQGFLRVCPETSSWVAKFSEHQAD
jgi:hypothetical protein